MVAGHIGGNDGQANHFAFAFLSRHDTDWDLGYSDVEISRPPPTAARASAACASASSSTGSGGTWSHRLSDRLSIGVSPFVAYRAQRSRRSLTLEELSADASSAAFVAQARTSTTTCVSSRRRASRGGPAAGSSGPRSPPRASSSGATASRSSTPAVAGAGRPRSSPRARRRASTPRTTRPGRWRAARPGAAARRRSTRRSSGSRPWPRTTSCSPEPAPVAGSAQTVPARRTGERPESVVNFGDRPRAPPRRARRAVRGRGAQRVGLDAASATPSPRGTSPT